MQVMGISGLPGSGKSLVSEIAIKRGAVIVSMGDIIREEAKKRGESTKETAQKLREEFGQYIVSELTIKKVKKLQEEDPESKIIVEGIRSPHEVDMFKENFEDFIILSIFANPSLRFERLKLRMREDDSTDYAEFKNRDQMELDFGIGDVISLSDKIIINESDLESYKVIADIVKNVEIINDNIGISVYEEKDKNANLICARAADELLTINSITASFVIGNLGDKICISGRSIGDINVQIILEKLRRWRTYYSCRCSVRGSYTRRSKNWINNKDKWIFYRNFIKITIDNKVSKEKKHKREKVL